MEHGSEHEAGPATPRPQHSPGPWHVSHYPDQDVFRIADANGWWLAELTPQAIEEDATLIAAAPDLLAALTALLADCSDPKRLHLISIPVLIQVDAAIAKAEGRDGQ